MVDVLVIGGGIHGAGVAQAACAAGYSVLLLEQSKIASGTSSRSSKLIHGGLRYLESGQFRLVHECLQERKYLLKNAPHLVKLVPFIIPVYQQSHRSALKIRMGLSLYALLGGMNQAARFRSIPRPQWPSLDGLQIKKLNHVFQYWDAQTDDQALTRSVIKSAQDMGARIIEDAEFLKAIRKGDSWIIEYNHGGEMHSLNAQAVVNTAGPWVNQVLSKVTSQPDSLRIDLVKGTHIVIDMEMTSGIYYLESPDDKRAIFVMPWYGKTMVGTTEEKYEGDPAKVSPSQNEIEYLLRTLRHYFPELLKISTDDIARSFAGLRVLPAAEGDAFSRPRETTVWEDRQKAQGFFSVYGGKLTAYRATSQLVMQKLATILPEKSPLDDTRTMKLPIV